MVIGHLRMVIGHCEIFIDYWVV